MTAALLLHPLSPSGLGFTVHLSTVLGIAELAAIYVWRARKGPPGGPTTGQRASFVAGLGVLFLSLNGPLHDLSDGYLFSAHMVQHLLLTMLVPPLLIAGTPDWMVRPAIRYPWVLATARRLTAAPAAFAIFTVTLALWHLPPLYNYAMAHHGVHIVQHLCFLVAATIMWWPLMSPLPELPRLSYPKQMLYAITLSFPMSLIAIILTYAETTFYPAYTAAPRIWGITPQQDQSYGGLLMWIPGGMIFFAVASVRFFQWAGGEEDSQRDYSQQSTVNGQQDGNDNRNRNGNGNGNGDSKST